jgi:hypothetical protein
LSTDTNSDAPTLALLAGERFKDESDQALLVCNDWLRRGRFRSLRQLCDFYSGHEAALFGAMSDEERALLADESESPFRNIQVHSGKSALFSPPTLGTLFQWSSRFNWREWARLYDAVEEGERNARRRMVVEQGLANDFSRVQLLKALAQKLRVELFTSGLFAIDRTIIDYRDEDRVETAEKGIYNTRLVNDLLTVLGDIAKEKGERGSLPSLDAALKSLEARIDYSKLTPEQIARLRNGTETIVEILLEPYLLPLEAE